MFDFRSQTRIRRDVVGLYLGQTAVDITELGANLARGARRRLARRLEDRMVTVERLVANDHPEFRPLGRSAAVDDEPISDLERILADKKGHRP